MTDHYHSISPSFISLPIYTNSNVPSNTAIGVGNAIYTSDSYWTEMLKYPQTYQSKEKPMSVLDKVRAEREDARERQRVEASYAAWDEFELETFSSGTVLSFDVAKGSDFRRYAALIIHDDGAKWFVTGRESPNGAPTEDFVAWLIRHRVEVADVSVLAEERS